MGKMISTGFLTGAVVNGLPIQSNYPCHTSNYTNMTQRNIKYVVMHYTGNTKDTAINNVKYYSTAANVQASAHLFVDDNSIYQSVELRDKAWHCGTSGTYYHAECRNANSIGIEMCCTAGNYTPSRTTITNAAHLCAYLCEMLNISANEVDTYVVRHYDVTHKECPRLMVRYPQEWVAFKQQVKDILNKKNEVVKEEDEMSYETFKEYMNKYLIELAEKPSDWEKDAMEWAVAQGLIKGDEKGRLMPKKFLTRGEMVTILQREATKK